MTIGKKDRYRYRFSSFFNDRYCNLVNPGNRQYCQ